LDEEKSKCAGLAQEHGLDQQLEVAGKSAPTEKECNK
jgi:hypothetical protein